MGLRNLLLPPQFSLVVLLFPCVGVDVDVDVDVDVEITKLGLLGLFMVIRVIRVI